MGTKRLVFAAILFTGCESPSELPTQVELRSEDQSGTDGTSSTGGENGSELEDEDEYASDPPPELTLEWLNDGALPLDSTADIRLTSQVDFPLEVVVRERWDSGGQEQNAKTLGSYALEPGSTLDLQVGDEALANAGTEYSGMLKVSVDLYDDKATRIATHHSFVRFFHRSDSAILFYDEKALVTEHRGGLLVGELSAAALEDDEGGNLVAVTRVRHGGAGVVGERVELGNPKSVEDAP